MKGTQQAELLKILQEKMSEIMLKKGDDYAGQEDRLFNFKAVSTMCDVSPAKVCQILMAVKMTRLTTLLKGMINGVSPKNESIEDSIVDLANYAALMDMCLKEDYTPQ